jgi:uncharacterized LabA/DUF88 family protein
MKTNVYIDGANLHKAIQSLGWDMDYRRFFVWLKDKYRIQYVYLFIGLIPKNKQLYTYLGECGYALVYKEVTYGDSGTVKGNCDADIVLKMITDFYEQRYDRAVLVSSDGDYASTVQFLKEKGVFRTLISPGSRCSILLRRLNVPIVYLHTQKHRLQLVQKEKAPNEDGTSSGSLS